MNERVLEYAFALEHIAAHGAKTVLDVGTGKSAWPALLKGCGLDVTASDSMRAYWGKKLVNPHCPVVDDDITDTRLTGPYDAITCISALEHMPEHRKAVASMLSLLAPGGCLIITVPYNDTRYVEDVYKLPEAGYGNPRYVCQVFDRATVEEWGRIDTLVQWRVFSGELWTFGERVPYERVESGGHLAGIVCSPR